MPQCPVQRTVFGQPARAPGPLAEERQRGRSVVPGSDSALVELLDRGEAVPASKKDIAARTPDLRRRNCRVPTELRDAIDLTEAPSAVL